jgi:two-component system, LytTR family, response regulator
MFQSTCINRFIGKHYLDTKNIIRCQASSNYTKLFFTNQHPIVIAKTLSACADALSDNNFIRIHQSHLVNRVFVAHIEPNGNVHLKDGTVCNISRRKKQIVKQMLCAF